MIVGAHSIVYSTNAEADRAFLRDILGFPHVDVGGGWLIFGLPPSEVAVHPAEKNDEHELYLMCDDVAAFVAEMAEKGFSCSPPQDQGYGIMTSVTLPGGGGLGVYQARHARPEPMGLSTPKRKPATRAKAKVAKPQVAKSKVAKPQVAKPQAAKPRAAKAPPKSSKKAPARRVRPARPARSPARASAKGKAKGKGRK